MRRTSRLVLALLATAAVLAAGVAGPASGASNPVIADCVSHAQLTHSYTIKQLQQALKSLSAETREYTNCSDVVNRALNAAISGKSGSGGTGGGGSGSSLPTALIVVLVILALAAIMFGAVAIRRRAGGDEAS